MRTLVCIILVAGSGLILPAATRASVIVNLNNPGSTTLHEVQVVAGETFTLNMNVASDQSVGVVSLAVQASSGGIFDITSVTDTPPWSSEGTVSQMVGGIDPVSGGNAFTRRGPSSGPTFAELEIAIDPNASPGDYTIDAVQIWCAQSPFVLFFPGQGGPSFDVHVVPEPATSLLLLLPGLLVVRRQH